MRFFVFAYSYTHTWSVCSAGSAKGSPLGWPKTSARSSTVCPPKIIWFHITYEIRLIYYNCSLKKKYNRNSCEKKFIWLYIIRTNPQFRHKNQVACLKPLCKLCTVCLRTKGMGIFLSWEIPDSSKSSVKSNEVKYEWKINSD